MLFSTFSVSSLNGQSWFKSYTPERVHQPIPRTNKSMEQEKELLDRVQWILYSNNVVIPLPHSTLCV